MPSVKLAHLESDLSWYCDYEFCPPVVGDRVGVTRLIEGYGAREWELVPAWWFHDSEIPAAQKHSASYNNRTSRFCGPATVTRVTASRVYFEFN